MDSGKTHHHHPQMYYYTYGPHAPALRVSPGDTLVTTTVDALNIDETGREIPRQCRQTSPDTSFKEFNPLTGPYYVEGTEPGDVLVVHIRQILLTRDFVNGGAAFDGGGLAWGISAGLSLGPRTPTPESKAYSWRIDRDQGFGNLELPDSRVGRVKIPLQPHFGCIGVAPAWGQFISSITPAQNGGNMDCVETAAGTTVYLPVFVRGAYLFVGDVHAAQGDGELCGGGLDITAEVTLELDRIPAKRIEWPRMENEEWLMVAASARPLMDAFRLGQVELIRWLEQDYGYDPLDALHLITQVETTRVGNVVDPQFTVVAKFPKRYLPEGESPSHP